MSAWVRPPVDGSSGLRVGEVRDAAPEVLHPDGRVREDHFRRLDSRRRAGKVRVGMVPPRAARRRAASRWMRASRPMRTRAVFSVSPVYSTACASRESSMFSVVLIHAPMPFSCASVKGWIGSSSQRSARFSKPVGAVHSCRQGIGRRQQRGG